MDTKASPGPLGKNGSSNFSKSPVSTTLVVEPLQTVPQNGPREPNCLFPEEVQALLNTFKQIKLLNLDKEVKKPGWASPKQRLIDGKCNRWINVLTFIDRKRNK